MLVGGGLLVAGTLLVAQDLESYRWNSRLLLIHTNGLESEAYQNQVAMMKRESEGLRERRLVIFTFWKDQYRVGIEDSGWKTAEPGFTGWTNPDSGFEVILIGLDGGVKLRHEQAIKPEELFARIEAMPMRRQEIRNK